MYTIHFQPNNQDNLNFIPFSEGDATPSFLNYDEVLAHSIKTGYIKSESEIKTLVDGSNHIEAYFTSMSAAEDCAATLGGIDDAPEFQEDEEDYYLYE